MRGGIMYVKRDAGGNVVQVSRDEAPGCTEFLPVDAPEILSFLERDNAGHLYQLRSSDMEFVRVLEDVIELLIGKGVISFTDLPEMAREKLIMRQSMRRQVNSVDLLGDEDEGII